MLASLNAECWMQCHAADGYCSLFCRFVLQEQLGIFEYLRIRIYPGWDNNYADTLSCLLPIVVFNILRLVRYWWQSQAKTWCSFLCHVLFLCVNMRYTRYDDTVFIIGPGQLTISREYERNVNKNFTSQSEVSVWRLVTNWSVISSQWTTGSPSLWTSPARLSLKHEKQTDNKLRNFDRMPVPQYSRVVAKRSLNGHFSPPL